MDRPIEGYIPVQEAAKLLGLSRPTIYRRLQAYSTADSSVQYTDSTMDSPDSTADSRPASIKRGKKLYVSVAFVQLLQQEQDAADSTKEQAVQYTDSVVQYMDSTADTSDIPADSKPSTSGTHKKGLHELELALMDAQGKVAVLEATNTALQAHIDNLKTLLDREQAIRMAAEQKRLPAGGLFAWIKSKTRGNT